MTSRRDYAYEDKQRFIAEVSARTPIARDTEPLWLQVVGGISFIVFVLTLCFI